MQLPYFGTKLSENFTPLIDYCINLLSWIINDISYTSISLLWNLGERENVVPLRWKSMCYVCCHLQVYLSSSFSFVSRNLLSILEKRWSFLSLVKVPRMTDDQHWLEIIQSSITGYLKGNSIHGVTLSALETSNFKLCNVKDDTQLCMTECVSALTFNSLSD